MPTASPELPALPQYDVPVIDPTTGRMSLVWYTYLRALDGIVRTLQSEIP